MAKQQAFSRAILAAAWARPKVRAALKAGFKKKYKIDIQSLQDLLDFIIENLPKFQQIVEFILAIIAQF
jgi:hypothetical protein